MATSSSAKETEQEQENELVVVLSAEERGTERKKIKVRNEIGWGKLQKLMEQSLGDEGRSDDTRKEWVYLYFNLESKRKEVLEDNDTLRSIIRVTEKHTLFVESGAAAPQYYPAIRLFAISKDQLQLQISTMKLVEPDVDWMELRHLLMGVTDEEDASIRPFAEWVSQLLELPADQRLRKSIAQDERGSTLLHLAVSCDLPRIVAVLSQVVDPLLLNREGLSCLHVGVIANNQSAIAALLGSLPASVARAAITQPVAKTSGSRLVPIATQGQTSFDLSPTARITNLLLTHR